MTSGQESPPARRGAIAALVLVTLFAVAGREARAQEASPAAQDCLKGFLPLREEAERRGKLIKAASERHAPPSEACKLINDYNQAEINMINYVESHVTICRIPAQIADQMKSGHKTTETLLAKVCMAAEHGDYWPSVALPPRDQSPPADPKAFWRTPQSPFVR
jgi:hypothetical protein